MSSSPPLSEGEEQTASGSPGATGLRYTQTIMGPSRSGAFGIRTSARRASSNRASATPRQLNGHTLLSEPEASVDEPPELAPKGVAFVPQFKGAAEMEARRRARMQARKQIPIIGGQPPSPVTPLNPELSSSDGEISMEDEDPFDGGDRIDDGDEFDP